MNHDRIKRYLVCACLAFLLLFTGCVAQPTEPAAASATPPEEEIKEISIGERACLPDTTELVISQEAEYADLLEKSEQLPSLKKVRLEGELVTAERIRELRSLFPELQLNYDLTLRGETVPWYTEFLDLRELEPEALQEAAAVIPLLPKLYTVQLPETFFFADYAALKDAAPQVDFEYRFTLHKQELDTHSESVEFTKAKIGNEGVEEIAAMLPYLENLTSLRFDRCGVDDEVMDQLRRDFPDRDIVWRVESLPGGGQMTDAIRIWIIGGYDDERLAPLKYCTKVKYLDIGHNGIENLDFLYYMPDLEVLIVENDHVSDITAIGSCRNLEYLEVGETRVTDISPLANCTNLVHLNIGRLHELTDISPLFGLTKLERVYGKCDENVPPEQVEHLRELLPNCEIRFEDDPVGPIFGSWRYLPGGGLVPRYWLLHEQIGYDW